MSQRMMRGSDGKFAFPFDPYNISPQEFSRRIEAMGYDVELLKQDLFDSVLSKREKINFLRMADYLNDNICRKQGKAQQYWDDFIEDTHPFYFLRVEEENAETLFDEHGDIVGEVEELDLPYPVCHFEAKEQHLATLIVPEDRDEDYEWCFLTSIAVREIAPKEYKFFAWTTVRQHGHILMENRALEIDRRLFETWKLYNGIVSKLLKRLEKDVVGVETSAGRKIKIGSGKDKRFWRPRPIVHVSPKKSIQDMRPFEGAEIDWSHRWEVRGHWREVKGIGKNRDGEYKVTGFTWVMNHVRGPEDKPIIKKTYVVET